LISSSEQMLDAPDVSSLWQVMAREAARLIGVEDVAVVQHLEPAAGLLVATGVSVHPDAPSRVAAMQAAARHGLLWRPRRVDDLAVDPLWASAQLPAGSPAWRSLLVVPLDGLPGKNATRLAWFSTQVEAFDREVEVADLFGRHASAAVRTLVARETLTEAIAARHRIGQAQGILMARYKLNAEQAFDVFKRRSQAPSAKLHTVADHVIWSGELAEHWMIRPRKEQEIRPEAASASG
jgi:hypothetical protein